MKSQINLLNQLQELVLTRDEHHQTGDGSHMEALDASIDALIGKLGPQAKVFYQRLYKKDHVVMAPMVNGCCAVCGMRLPISQVQQVRLAKTLQVCSSCGRIIYDEEEDDKENALIYFDLILRIHPEMKELQEPLQQVFEDEENPKQALSEHMFSLISLGEATEEELAEYLCREDYQDAIDEDNCKQDLIKKLFTDDESYN